MPSDDSPIEAIRHQLDLEQSSTSPVAGRLTKILALLTSKLPPPLGAILGILFGALKDCLSADSDQRIAIVVETVANETLKHDIEIRQLKERMSAHEIGERQRIASELLVDAARKAVNTRSIERVKRIAIILANSVRTWQPLQDDETEEMMRVAMEVGETDFKYLVELARIEGAYLENHGHVDRYNAHTFWEHGFWGTNPGGESESVFRKLESYGLVATIPAPSNLNIMADIQTRFVLLAKGLRFVKLATPSAV